jgi:hypothetical protein
VRAEEVTVKRPVLSLTELRVGFIFVPLEVKLRILWAGFQATAATHALAERVGPLLRLRRLARSRTKVVVAIHGNPPLHLLQCSKEAAAVYDQIAYHGELRKRAKLDRLGMVGQKLIDKRRTSLPYPTIDEHRAGTTDFLQAIGVVSHRSYVFPAASPWVGCDSLQYAGHVYARIVCEAESLPIARSTRPILPQDANIERALHASNRLRSLRHCAHSASV